MSRRASRITQDEVARMIRAVTGCGLSIGRVMFDGERVDVVIDNGDIGETSPRRSRQPTQGAKPLREPQL